MPVTQQRRMLARSQSSSAGSPVYSVPAGFEVSEIGEATATGEAIGLAETGDDAISSASVAASSASPAMKRLAGSCSVSVGAGAAAAAFPAPPDPPPAADSAS